ncbi:GH92 family glycosyl hydrolase [Parabacteroides distasonis]|uniref:Glycoside hydrolase family 92 protein n=2 Tax=Parabacteroides distasonis TaxID=823 RepID=A0A6I2N5D8_PARDI|nr:GH92 family glycosyl hydrolase [Parabacteroides distasonis]MRY83183.1 glycoside hydrolase family 92 protein [Parabacteroides distasonis]MRZ05117.1 glycoside hydrolase family 92 protein [Parabacteroides distasonis]
MSRIRNFFMSVFLFAHCVCMINAQSVKTPVDYVNTRIGNISHLLVPTFPATHQPNSMIRMIPGHHDFVTDRMRGFPLNVPSHRQGDVLLLMPYRGTLEEGNEPFVYRYDHERSTPYLYSVFLDDYGVEARFAPMKKAAIYSFAFEPGDTPGIILRTNGQGELVWDAGALSGYEVYNGIKHYFYLEFNQSPTRVTSLDWKNVQARAAAFDPAVKRVVARYGVSYISVDQARKNLKKEIADFDLERVADHAKLAWNEALSKIKIEGGTEDQRTVFYTSLYRAHERMINISEDGNYFSAYDGKVHADNGVDFWVDDWVWDTYLALHPLQILLNPKEQEQKLASYIRMYEQSGWMPTFPCVFGDAHCMNGNHAASVFADALNKGLRFDVEKAFEGMKHTVMTESMIPWYRGPKTALDDFYHEHGWFPALHPGEKEEFTQVGPFEQRQAAAVTTAASYDDWCIAQLAKYLGRDSDYRFFEDRSYNYRNVFNKKTKFFHPKDKDGNFIEPFDYIFSGGIGSRAYFDENNAWTYNWDVRHRISDLIDLFGGEEPFITRLDQLFVEGMTRAKWQYYAVHPDATGNVGQFVMGNEPSFHIPYLYNYVGQPWKTQKRIRMLMESWFRNDLMGVCGDEDGGGMSAFYIFSSLGFYPVSPGIPMYAIGSPLFERSEIRLANGKVFTVIAHGASWENKYIQSAKLNGVEYDKTWFTHENIMEGGTLELLMGNRPNKGWGIGEGATPPSSEFVD